MWDGGSEERISARVGIFVDGLKWRDGIDGVIGV
jgi:hypothetical protein